MNFPFCHVDTNWLTQIKGAASYTVPRIDVSVSGDVSEHPGSRAAGELGGCPMPAISRRSAGRSRAARRTRPSTCVAPGTEYGAWLNQLDLRFAKIIRFGATRTTINFDLYNALNANTILTYNNNFVRERRRARSPGCSRPRSCRRGSSRSARSSISSMERPVSSR